MLLSTPHPGLTKLTDNLQHQGPLTAGSVCLPLHQETSPGYTGPRISESVFGRSPFPLDPFQGVTLGSLLVWVCLIFSPSKDPVLLNWCFCHSTTPGCSMHMSLPPVFSSPSLQFLLSPTDHCAFLGTALPCLWQLPTFCFTQSPYDASSALIHRHHALPSPGPVQRCPSGQKHIWTRPSIGS